MKKFTIILLLVLSIKNYGQTNYYTTDGKKVFSKETLDKMVVEIKTKYTKIFKKEMFVGLKIQKTIQKQDSIINQVSFDIKDKKTYDQDKKSIIAQLEDKEFPEFKLETLLGENFDSEKLKGKFNFIAITYESKKHVEKFLAKYPFKFIQLVNSENFIDKLKI